jgi:hypothetical protein
LIILPSFQSTSAITLPDEVKVKLIEVLPLVNKDIGLLEPIRTIFKQIQGQLPRDLQAENWQLVVQEDQDRLGERRR